MMCKKPIIFLVPALITYSGSVNKFTRRVYINNNDSMCAGDHYYYRIQINVQRDVGPSFNATATSGGFCNP